MSYVVLIERGPTSFGASVPDLPGCVAVGDTEAEVMRLIREAMGLHLDGMREDGDPVPRPTVRAVEVSASEATAAAEALRGSPPRHGSVAAAA